MRWVAQRLSADRATNSRRIAVSTSVIVGGSNGLGCRLAQRHADRGHSVFITSRHAARAKEAAAHIGGNTIGLVMDLAEPETLPEPSRSEIARSGCMPETLTHTFSARP